LTFWLGCDRNLSVGTLLEADIIAMFIRQRILNAKISIALGGPFNCSLCLFPSLRAWRQDDFVQVSSFNSAILADLDIRGLAISFFKMRWAALREIFEPFSRSIYL
jgi:hypothetical protein